MNGKSNTKKSPKAIKKMAMIMVVCAALILLLLLIKTLSGTHAPDPMKMTPQANLKYMASKEFAALPKAEKESYFSRLRQNHNSTPPQRPDFSTLSQAERENLRKNTGRMMQKEMRERMKQFFSLSREEQDKYLDKMIKERQQRRQQELARNGGTGNNNPPPGGPPEGGNRQAMMQSMLENTDSNSRAQMHEFMSRLRAREQQTGQMPPRP